MKTWVFTIIILSLCGKLIKNLLPRGEKSPLHASLRLLLSLSIILIIIFPMTNLFGVKREKFTLEFDTQANIDTSKIILEKMQKTIKRSVDTAFPEEEYSLNVQTNEEGIPNLIIVTGGESADIIADFITRNYGLNATTT